MPVSQNGRNFSHDEYSERIGGGTTATRALERSAQPVAPSGVSAYTLSMRIWAAMGSLLLVLAPAGGAGAVPRTYDLQRQRSTLVAHLLKGGAGSRFAHDHVVQARELSGVVVVDRAVPSRARISVTVKTRGLRADDPALRRAYGLKGKLSEADRRKVEQNMRSRSQLNTARYPQMTFVSRRVVPLAGGRFRVYGALTIRGVTRPAVTTVLASVSGATFKGSCQLRIRQSRFGYEPYSAMLGLVSVRDVVTINIYLQGKLRP